MQILRRNEIHLSSRAFPQQSRESKQCCAEQISSVERYMTSQMQSTSSCIKVRCLLVRWNKSL